MKEMGDLLGPLPIRHVSPFVPRGDEHDLWWFMLFEEANFLIDTVYWIRWAKRRNTYPNPN